MGYTQCVVDKHHNRFFFVLVHTRLKHIVYRHLKTINSVYSIKTFTCCRQYCKNNFLVLPIMTEDIQI